MRRGDERRQRNRDNVKGARRKRVHGGTNGKRDRDRISRKKHGVMGAGKGKAKKGIRDIVLELLK